MRLTVGITAYYKSDFDCVKRMIWSLLDKRSTSEKKPSELVKLYETTELMCITINEPVEILLFVDRDGDSNNSNVDEIIKYYKSLSIPNCSFRLGESTSNVRVSVARNFIIAAAQGDYVTFNDDDDLSVNINVLLNFIDNSPPAINVINYGVNDDNRMNHTSIMLPTSVLCKTSFLRENNLSFVPDMATEDVVWRSDINAMWYSTPSTELTEFTQPYSGYFHIKSRGSSTEITINGRRFPRQFDEYNEELMKDDTFIYDKIVKVMTHNNNMSYRVYGDFQLFAINTSCALQHGFPLIKLYFQHHLDQSNEVIRNILEVDNQLDGTCDFWKIPDKRTRNLCFYLFCQYSTLSELYHFSRGINPKNPLVVLNKIWKNKFPLNALPKNYKSETLDRFTYRYMCLRWLRGEKIWCDVNVDVLNMLKKMMTDELNRACITDVMNYIVMKGNDDDINVRECAKWYSSMRANGDVYEMVKNVVGEELYGSIVKYVKEYVRENDITTTGLGYGHEDYKGFITAFLFLLLSIAPQDISNVDSSGGYRGDEVIEFILDDARVSMKRRGFDIVSTMSGGDYDFFSVGNNVSSVMVNNDMSHVVSDSNGHGDVQNDGSIKVKCVNVINIVLIIMISLMSIIIVVICIICIYRRHNMPIRSDMMSN